MNKKWKNLLLGDDALEEQQQNYAYCYSRIGYVKYGTKEDIILPAQERNPGRVVALQNGEVEHVDYPAVQKMAVATPGG
jgi:hypothetical protein